MHEVAGPYAGRPGVHCAVLAGEQLPPGKINMLKVVGLLMVCITGLAYSSTRCILCGE